MFKFEMLGISEPDLDYPIALIRQSDEKDVTVRLFRCTIKPEYLFYLRSYYLSSSSIFCGFVQLTEVYFVEAENKVFYRWGDDVVYFTIWDPEAYSAKTKLWFVDAELSTYGYFDVDDKKRIAPERPLTPLQTTDCTDFETIVRLMRLN